MSKAYIEALIPKAIGALESNPDFANGSIDSVYQGYISSFGVGIVQVGLLPTLAYFESESAESKGERQIISDLVRDTLELEAESLLTHTVNIQDRETLEDQIKDASVAVKLSMRLFDLGNGGVS